MDGFQVVEAVGAEEMPVTIFVTAFDRYAIRAFDSNAVDYLLKPFAPDRLTRALARARERCLGRQDKDAAQRLFALLDTRLQSDYAQRITVAHNGRILFVPVAEIDWIEAEGNYARLHVSRKIYDVRETLQALMEKLDPREFIRIHRSTIVNVRRIREVQPWFQGSHIVVLQSGEELRMFMSINATPSIASSANDLRTRSARAAKRPSHPGRPLYLARESISQPCTISTDRRRRSKE